MSGPLPFERGMMPNYSNGYIPDSLLVSFKTGY